MIYSVFRNISFLVTKKQKLGLYLLTSLILIGMVLEMFGLGILIPTITIVQKPEIVIGYKDYFSLINITGYDNIIRLLIGALFIINILRAFFMLILTHLQNKFTSKVISKISVDLYNLYLKNSYTFYLNKNTSKLVKNIQTEVGGFSSYLSSFISLITEGMMISAVIITVFLSQPFGALIFFVFISIISFLIFRVSKKKLNNYAITRENYDSKISKTLIESFAGIKDLKIFNKEDHFIKEFSKLNFNKFNIQAKYLTVNQIPRYLLEVTLIIGVLIFISLMLITNSDSSEIISSLGLFIAASFRLIPSVNKIITSLQMIEYNKVSTDLLINEFNSISNNIVIKDIVNSFSERITFESIHFKYPNQEKLQLKNLEFKILKGQKIGIIGESGSGKSTLIDIIMGLFEPLKGEIKIDNRIVSNKKNNWSPLIGYVPQSIFLIDDTIENNISLYDNKSNYDKKRLNNVIKNVGLEKFIGSLPNGLKTKVGEKGLNISGGQLQRIGLARAFYRNPQILILDESTSALDPETEKIILDSIYKKDNNLTVIFISHKSSNLEKCDLIYKMENNKISQL